MQIFKHLANDELRVLYEQNRNKVHALAARTKHSHQQEGGLLRRKSDLEAEMALIREELSNRAPGGGRRDFRDLH